jgi:hypothetical protein
MKSRRDDSISLDDLNPFELEGSPEDIALVERGLAIMSRKQKVWASVVEGWKRDAGIMVVPIGPTVPTYVVLEPGKSAITGTVAGLVHHYKTDGRSPYRRLRFKTRETYDSLIRRILTDCGEKQLAELKRHNIQELYDRWRGNGRLGMAHGLITMLRGLVHFGAGTLEDRECEIVSVVLHNMNFPTPKSRTEGKRSERLTAEHADAIRAKAHQMGRPSIALAQALQFGLRLGQKDVIGEWLPLSEPGDSDVISDGKKWLRGLRWEQIDSNFLLRRAAVDGGKGVEVDLRSSAMVMDELDKELARLNGRPTSGPVVLCEYGGLPWTSYEFRRWWRQVANAAGIPKTVKNMDSFAGSKKGSPPVARSSNGVAHDGYHSAEETETGRATEDLPSVARH